MEITALTNGTFFSRKSYMRILENNVLKNGDLCIHVENEMGMDWFIPHSVLDKETCDSASQYSREKEVSRTEIVKAIREAGDSVFTVCFNKKIEPKTISEAIMSLYANSGGKIISKAEFQKKATEVEKQVKAGETRVMVAKLVGTEDIFGRFQAYDLEIPFKPVIKVDGTGTNDNRHRQIDQLSIQWAIVKGVKYTAK